MSRSSGRSWRPFVLTLGLVLLAGACLLVYALRAPDGTDAAGAPAAGSGAAGATATDPPYDGSADSGGVAAPVTATSTAATSTPAAGAPDDGGAGAPGGGDAGASGPRSVTVSTTYSGWDESSSSVVTGGFIDGLIEPGGTCTLTLSRGGVVVAGTSESVADVRTTSCGQVSIPGGDLAAGNWSAVLSYRSGTAEGASPEFTVVVP
ncbi:hypothetical protein JD79_02091 [Geodermatophilus normandii]|uniref:Uncharacterized protein n=1 Tax=Geodermatophilus normandii TaxID=1137989 RepID=A0A317QGX3_9ACTN|nr:hypothetical protein [Geodermatophilus normandii]PWW22928.1 hypothetical protein JD79_02091 [Geodermatophilus normandii]